MQELLTLFLFFFKVGLLSFGGGYAVIPVIQQEVEARNWLTAAQFQEIVALSGMAPGPIATNTTTMVGYQIAGFVGAVVATVGIILPSLIIIVLLGSILFRIRHYRWVKAFFYGLKPVVTGLIVFAAIHFGTSGSADSLFTWSTLVTAAICVGAIIAMMKYKTHPLLIIIGSALAGIILL